MIKFKRFFAAAMASVTAVTMTVSANAASSFVYGDLDGDRYLTINDLVRMNLYVNGISTTINEAAADVNCDGTINKEDLELMRRASVGLITLPVKKSTEYSFSQMVYPSTVYVNNAFYLGGIISSSGGDLSYVSGEIIDSSGTVVMSQTEYVNGNSLSLRSSSIDTYLKFGRLSVGEYTLKYTAVGTDGSSKSVSYGFKVITKSGTISENENQIYNFLINEMGYNKAAAVGVLANIKAESNFNPNLYGDNNSSMGICQWHNGRLTAMKNFCTENGYDATSLYGQLRYLQRDLTRNYPSVDRYLRNVTNDRTGAYNAAAYFCKVFEVPARKDYMADLRGNSAMNVYWYRH